MKPSIPIAILAAATNAIAAIAAIPVPWTVETSRIEERRLDAFHGEELLLEASLKSLGKPLSMTGKSAMLYWQTNGMDRLYWSTNATVASGTDGATNVLKAVFSPSMDPGASAVHGFIGIAGENYRANFTIRFRDSPGAEPNVITPPVAGIDFSRVEVTNAPWIAESAADARFATIAQMSAKADATNVYTKSETVSYVQQQITSAGSITESTVSNIVTAMGSEFGRVQSVNGHTGTVTLAASDVGALPVTNQFDSSKYIQWGNESALNLHGTLYASEVYSEGMINASATMSAAEFYHQGKAVVYGITTNGTDYLHSDVNLQPIASDSRNALAYASGIYQYMNANTNAWFEGTNYNVSASVASNKVTYAAEAWEDVAYTPCSLQLYEIRDGARQKVWDQRDWTVYYWNFKSAQLSNNLARTTAALSSNVASNCMTRGWSKYTAVNGLDNPNPGTLFVDTEKVSLMAGMQWEKMFELSGHAYYTISGNGITISTNDQSSTFLSIKDFEGNACLTFRKTSSYLVYCECGSEITNSFIDASGNVCFRILTDTQPTAEFSTTLDDEDFVEQGENGCPANYEWTGSAGNWVCHFLLKSGIESDACFARFKILREGENIVEHSVPVKLDGGIIFTQGGTQYKIKPSVSGSTVTWSIVQ